MPLAVIAHSGDGHRTMEKSMKVEINDTYGRFHWTLLDGPDGIDEASGIADSFSEACRQIELARATIADSYKVLIFQC